VNLIRFIRPSLLKGRTLNLRGGNPQWQVIIYDDAVLPELLDVAANPVVPFMRKRTVWSHEREWRMLDDVKACKKFDAASRVSLFEIPNEAILGVLLGFKMPEEARSRILQHQVLHAPHVQLRAIQPNYSTGLLESLKIGPS
jgi:hypothetical protein